MPNFTYNRDVPDGPNNPSDDQPDMKINTNSTDDLIAVDHYTFNNNKGGHHKQVHLYNQAAPGLAGADADLFANTANSGAFGVQSYPYWQNALGSFLLVNFPTADAATGFTSLSGGILLQWGIVAGSNANTIPVLFPTPFLKATLPTPAYFVSIMPERAASSPGPDFATVIVTGSISSTGFTIGNIGSHTMVNWYWAAIGPQS